MSHTYNAAAGSATPGSALTLTVPDDGDARTAAAQNTPDQKMSDLLEYVRGALWSAANVLGTAFLKRIRVGGTALVNADFGKAGWGATATISGAGGYDMAGQVSVTAGGAGIAANPTVSFSFKDGTMNSGVVVLVNCYDSTGAVYPCSINPSAGATIDMIVGTTPVAARTYTLYWMAVRTA